MRITRIAAGVLVSTLCLAGCAGTADDGGDADGGGGELSAVPGFDPETGTIKVGVINPLTGPLAAGGQGLLQGLELYVERINADGGIAGQYPVELVVADSEYDPQQGIAAYNGMADDVVMIGAVLGTGVVKALLPQAAADNMLIIPGSDSADWLRDPNALPIRPTYQTQVINAIAYAAGNDQDQRFCALLQDDPLGEAVKDGVDHAVEELGLDYGDEVRFPTSSTDFTPQISQLKSGGCDVVVYGASSASAIPAMSSAVQLDFTPQWLAIGPGFAENLLASPIVDYISEHWVVGSPAAEWGDTSVPGMEQLVDDFSEYAEEGDNPQPVLNQYGYTYGIALSRLLGEAVEQGDLSHESLLEISHSDLSLDFMGLTPEFQYGPVEERQAPSAVTIFEIDTGVTGGLAALEKDFDSDAAQSYEFQG